MATQRDPILAGDLLARPGSTDPPTDARPHFGDTTLPPSERSEDSARAAYMDSLTAGSSRPLTADEKHAAEESEPSTERVYAPASERVPKRPAPGHEDIVGHVDRSTPERRAAGAPTDREAPDPGKGPESRWFAGTAGATGSANGGWATSPYDAPQRTGGGMWRGVLFGLGMGTLPLAAGLAVGLYLYRRREQERNKPINRLRRGVVHAGSAVAERIPSREVLVRYVPDRERAQPLGIGGVALLALAMLAQRLIERRQSESSSPSTVAASARDSVESLSDDVKSRLADVARRNAHRWKVDDLVGRLRDTR